MYVFEYIHIYMIAATWILCIHILIYIKFEKRILILAMNEH